MVNSISSANTSQVTQAAQPAVAKQPQAQSQPTTSSPSDKVTLKSTSAGGDVDHDGDSH
jgi:hypothetical protein